MKILIIINIIGTGLLIMWLICAMNIVSHIDELDKKVIKGGINEKNDRNRKRKINTSKK
jgi:hypothetical protein